LELQLKKVRKFEFGLFFQMTPWGKLFACYQAVLFGTGQGAGMPCDWEGNRRSDIALAMRQDSLAYAPMAHIHLISFYFYTN